MISEPRLLLKGNVSAHVRSGKIIPLYFRRVSKYATKQHQGQMRKDGITAYIKHPAAVAAILKFEAGVIDPVARAAAMLHDTIEDTGATRADIEKRFGSEVADLVIELTKNPDTDQATQRQAEINHKFTPRGAIVKLADKIANLRDILDRPPNWPTDTKRRYFAHARQVVDAMQHKNPQLLKLFNEVYDRGVAEL